MAGYLLDTTVLIDHARGHTAGVKVLARLFSETDQLFTCDVITAEALSGGDLAEIETIGRLLDALEYLAIDPVGARWAGSRRRELRAQGRRQPMADALIAAVAWRADATVVTRNPADFRLFGVPVLAY